MSTSFIFNGKVIKQPGSYAQTQSGIKNAPQALSYGNVLIIDTGSGAGFGTGAGIAGTLESAKDAVYTYDNVADFRSAIKGGLWWRLANPLFRPAGPGIPGVSTVYVVKAAATIPAEMSATYTGGGSNGGSFTVQVRDEGKVGNGIEGGETLATGSFEVAVVVSGDVFDVQVDEGSGAETIGSYMITGADTATTTAAAIALAINNNVKGYSVIVNGTTVVITARQADAFKDAADWNSYPLTVAITGTSTTANLTTFAGGVAGSKLTQGYAMTMDSGTIDTNKFIVRFYQGSFTGLDSENNPYAGVAAVDTDPILITQSPEFDNIQTLFDWMNSNAIFGVFFKLKTSAKNGTGAVTSTDKLANVGNNKAAGGTETYSSTHLQTVLDNIADLDYTFVLSDQYGTNAQSADNSSILTHIVDEARYEKFLVIAGGDTQNEWVSQSIVTARYWNSDRVMVVHGGPLISSQLSPTGFKAYSAIYKAAGVLGRIAGLEPQVPGTFKNLNIQGERHQLNNKEIDEALDAGVIVTKYDIELSTYAIVQAINTLQKNSNLVNEDATSHSVAVKRIAAQLNKEIVINAKQQLLGQTNGPNRNTLNARGIEEWLSGYLTTKTATDTADNLILGFQNIIAKVNGDAYEISYAFIPNFPVNKLFFTGFMIDPASV